VSCCTLTALAEGGDALLPYMLQRLLAEDRYQFSGEDRYFEQGWAALECFCTGDAASCEGEQRLAV